MAAVTSGDLALVTIIGWCGFSIVVLALDRLANGSGRRPRWIRFLTIDRGDGWEPVEARTAPRTEWSLAGTFDPADWEALEHVDGQRRRIAADPPDGPRPHLSLVPTVNDVANGSAGGSAGGSIEDTSPAEPATDEPSDGDNTDWADTDWDKADRDKADRDDTDTDDTNWDDADRDDTHLADGRDDADFDIALAIDLGEIRHPTPIPVDHDRADPFFADLIRQLSDHVARTVRAEARHATAAEGDAFWNDAVSDDGDERRASGPGGPAS